MIGVVADDLTGAAECGAAALRRGLSAEVLMRGQPSGTAQVVCINTDSRSCAAEEAGRRAAAAAALLHQAGARWIYKKTDSVLRGPVAAEVDAVRQQLDLRAALFLPANPSLGRVIRQGCYLVHGRPLDQTEFARDPEHPRESANVLELLAAPESTRVHLANPGTPLPNAGWIVGNVQNPTDLGQWAAQWTRELLPAGGVEFFAALLERSPEQDERHSPEKPQGAADQSPGRSVLERRRLFVCGSTSESAQRLAKAARDAGTPVFSLPEGFAQGDTFTPASLESQAQQIVAALRSRPVILRVGLPPLRQPAIARQLAGQLARLAQAVLRQVAVDELYLEGGATAAELVRQMGWARLAVLDELAPGVAALGVVEQSLRLTLKPGSYAWPPSVQSLVSAIHRPNP